MANGRAPAKIARTAPSRHGGAEFRFTGVPESWTTFPVPNPAMFAMGDPFGDGVVAVWPCARPEANGILKHSRLQCSVRADESERHTQAALQEDSEDDDEQEVDGHPREAPAEKREVPRRMSHSDALHPARIG